MQRNLADEVVTAVIALAVIAFAVVFGVLLSIAAAPQPTPTPTPHPSAAPLVTRTPSATIDFTPFATRVIATETQPVTATESPSRTAASTQAQTRPPSATATQTLPPTDTKTSTPDSSATATRPRPTQTRTPAPSETPTPTPSPTDTATSTSTPTPTATNTATVTPTATQTNTPTPAATRPPQVTGCFAPDIAFVDLAPGDTLSGLVEMQGTAAGTGFRRYHLEILATGAAQFENIITGNTPVRDRTLGLLDTSAYPPGAALIRLRIITDSGITRPNQVCIVPITLAPEP